MKPRWRRLLFSLTRIYLLLLVVIAVFQRKLLFFPTREPERVMLAIAEASGLEAWRDASGAIIGWKRRADPAAPAAHKLLVFHGNAGHALHREYYLRAFEGLGAGREWEVWLFEYPGYGARPGSPSREAFAEAGRAAVAQLRAQDSRPLFLLGESLGGGVTGDLASSEPDAIAGLVLVAPFARITDVARAHFPFLPTRWLLRDRWDNVSALADFRRPVAVLIGGRDEVVSAAQGEELFAKLHEPKLRWLFPEATHNSPELLGAGWAPQVSAFLLDPAHAKR